MRMIKADISFEEIYKSASSKMLPEMKIKTVCGVPVKKAEEIFEAYLKEIPAVDAVEVVRCKDCKYNDHAVCKKIWYYVTKNHFCSYGKRKESDDN